MATTKRARRGAAETSDAKDVVKPTASEEKVTESDVAMPKVVRVFLVCATSIMANYAWQNRGVVTDHLYNDNQTPTQQTMISVFAYFALMGVIFLGGLVMSKVTVLTSRLL
ncbi:hypothetical protein H310_11446 [Aphanomyces invadans]|uniref:Uncharacterized protein n=1 Tax=Aphanomyces invadans TaxID=157072 RepID=A0A024TMF3_9STRA|nr:hypothetical protein H310_11446 [Aphanomyces invadans]ETV95184.1 hypothetical protein H310_11446 [Aphanomyces invadans]|eukprot:XP_008876357.1 hypothetical protein H310_11446 [Aphanomyces invadans]